MEMAVAATVPAVAVVTTAAVGTADVENSERVNGE